MSEPKDALSRRRLLTVAAGTAGVAVTGSLLPPSVHQALADAPRSGGLRAIKHVVFLVQENRSFDHYFGTMRGVRGFGDRNAIELPNGRPVFEQPAGLGKSVLPFSVREAAGTAKKDLQFIGDLAHGWPDGQQARGDGWNNGWVAAKSPATMAYYDRHDIPFQHELASTFTICDAYHCSVFSSTSPNRNYFVSGYTGYEADGKKRAIDNAAYSEDNHPGYSWVTAAELLEKAGISWRVYQERDNFQDNNLEFFAGFKQIARKALQGDFKSLDSFYTTLSKADPGRQQQMLARLAEGVAKLTQAERSLYERALRRGEPSGLAAEFRKDVEAGKLPRVSYIVPSAADSEHPGASSPVQSANIVYKVLDAIAANREVWASTAVFITYDENDGLFDHVPPPVPPDDVADEHYDGKPIGLGFRVPMIIVSPWSVGGYVCSQVFDHSSMTRFLERWLDINAPDISAWRRTVAGDLTSAFDFHHTGQRPRVAQPGAVPPFTGRWHPAPPTDQKMPGQEPGTRRARSLPYQPNVVSRLDVRNRTLTLTMTNTGAESAHLAVYPYAGELPRPKHVDVERTHTESVRLAGDQYRLVVTGPNGFRRELGGSLAGAGSAAEVSSRVKGGGRLLWVTLINRGDAPLVFAVRPNAYAPGDVRKYPVRPGARHTVRWHTAGANGWYDLTVTVAQAVTFKQRLAGHIENGRESITG